MSWNLENLPPRSFVDFTVPKRPDGSELNACLQTGDYEIYVTWLAEYLHKSRIPLSAEEQRWLDQGQRSPENVVFECSELFGQGCLELESLASWFESGASHVDYSAEMRKVWLEATNAEQREESPFEDLSPATFSRLHREWLQEIAAEVELYHADIPFRPLLNWALRQIQDSDERQRNIDWYFRNLTENASK